MAARPPVRWGWHRLSDEWASRLVRRAGVSPGDLVLDVGAGGGAITAQLVARGARVVAAELHPGRARQLRSRFAGRDVDVVEVDAAALRLPRRPFRVVANPPFAVTTSLLAGLVGPRSDLVRADLVVPRHVAARWSGGRGKDASRWAATFAMTTTAWVPRSAFTPPPPSAAAVLTVVRRDLDRGVGRPARPHRPGRHR